ncbi:RNA polymerase sigma factor [Enterovirga sp. GCM10030262]|uniref:RNA polymerase sigma factor n=1 Tax=Enterovirga sp. GCM10030262 TaxID=3273391 RepID=UPI003606F08D
MATQPKLDYESLDDLAVAGRLAARDEAAVRLVTGRNNQRLFRAAWSILGDRADAEDAVQSAYLSAFSGIADFAGRSSLSTWLTRIVINEALGRKRAARRRRAHLDAGSVVVLDEYRDKLMRGSMTETLPDGVVARAEIRRLLEEAITRLPAGFRLVFVLREIEELSVEETSEALGIPPATVKTRHHRARRRLQDDLAPELRTALTGTFPFAGADCEGMTERVLRALP